MLFLADYKGTFFNAHPELEGKVVVHHAVEQQALQLYPNAVTSQQIHSSGEPEGNSDELELGFALEQN